MMTNKLLSNIIIAAAALLSTSSGFAPTSTINSSSFANQESRWNILCQEISSQQSIKCSSSSTNCRSLAISRMASDDEDVETTTDSSDPSTTAENEIASATAGGGTIALTSAKSAADAATTTTTNTNGANGSSSTSTTSSPSNTGFSLLLLPTLLFKFTIVLIVKFATDVVVYPTLYLWRWARVGRKKVGRGMARFLGKDDGDGEMKVNGATGKVANGDSVGDFQ